MAGETVTYAETRLGTVKQINAAWTSGDGGKSPDIATEFAYSGKVELLTTDPDDTANTGQVLGTSLGAVAMGKLTLGIASAGRSR